MGFGSGSMEMRKAIKENLVLGFFYKLQLVPKGDNHELEMVHSSPLVSILVLSFCFRFYIVTLTSHPVFVIGVCGLPRG